MAFTSEKVVKIPTLKCFPISRTVKAWCPFCNQWHTHGLLPGESARSRSHVVAHCKSDDSPFKETGYYLKLITKKEAVEFIETLQRYLGK